jgi:hypothetical protein
MDVSSLCVVRILGLLDRMPLLQLTTARVRQGLKFLNMLQFHDQQDIYPCIHVSDVSIGIM